MNNFLYKTHTAKVSTILFDLVDIFGFFGKNNLVHSVCKHLRISRNTYYKYRKNPSLMPLFMIDELYFFYNYFLVP